MGDERPYKIVLLGEVAVGKSSIVLRFIERKFENSHEPTIGAAFFSQTVDLDGEKRKLEIWDTAGQERYNSLAPMYYRSAHAAIVVFDITQTHTFQRAVAWIKEVRQQASPNVVIILVGNKCDLDDQRSVSRDQAEAFAREQSLVYLEVSAKLAINITEIFTSIARAVKPFPSARVSASSIAPPIRVQDDEDDQDGKKKGGCC